MSRRSAVVRAGVLGLDVGGANLKVATAAGGAVNVPFALWREPQALPDRLHDLLCAMPHDRLAVTMTGELCDCFATKREGVGVILDALAKAAPRTPARVWSTSGQFVTIEESRRDPQRVAALESSELVYTGVRRTPVCAVMGTGVAAELFATMHDVYLLLMKLPPAPENRDTADGRPATIACAHARLARMLCSDAEHVPLAQAVRLARTARASQVQHVSRALQIVVGEMGAQPEIVIVSGAGEFLARAALRATPKPRGYRLISLQRKLSAGVSTAACAYALAVLGEETWLP
jgi:uncharacterized hydantoinase/oxoprolinase family protein